MAALLDMTRSAAEPSLIIRWGGMPASWRWRGQMYDAAALHTHWHDSAGREWYRAESEEGLVFLLGRGEKGWVVALWPDGAASASRSESRNVSAI